MTSIGSQAFQWCAGLTSVTFASGSQLTSIGASAFDGCYGLTSITIPASVESIGSGAFDYCSGLTSITIPASVTSIGSYAFRCSNLESITVASGNSKYDSRNDCNAIIEKSTKTLVAGCKNTIIPDGADGVTSIGDYAFSSCTGLTSITIPASVTSIGSQAFGSCSSLASVTVYASTPPTLDSYVFINCASGLQIYVYSDLVDDYKANWSTYENKIKAISISGNCGAAGNESDVKWELALATTSGVLTITKVGSTGAMADYASASTQPWYSHAGEITSVVIEDGVTAIGSNAFNGCANLTTITLNGGATIGAVAFPSNTIPSNTTVTIASGLYLYNGTEVLSGDVTDMDLLNDKTLQPAVKITLPTGVTATGTGVINQTDETYAVSGTDVTIAAATGYIISNVNTTGADLTDNGDDTYTFTAGTTDVTVTATVLTNIVTQSNFFNYFDDNGCLLDNVNVPFNELIFQGNFTDTDLDPDINYITIDRPITITGDNAVLNNIGFVITGSDVTLDKVSVTYNAPNEVEAKAIFANGAENFTLTNSEIIFTGANPGEYHYRGLEVRNSNAAKIDKNTITATFPAVAVNWYNNGSIDQDLVLAVGIQGGEDIEFTNNSVTVNTNGGIGSYPTIDAVMVYSANNILIKGNNIRHIDTTTEDGARYYYSLDIYETTGIVEANDINVNTTTTPSVERAGTAYPIQVNGQSIVTVKDNNITAISKGPIAGIYATNWDGATNLTVENNNIDVTGYATTGNYALVAGIEAEIGITSEYDTENDVKVYNNTITVDNVADYDDAYQVYGVSMASSYLSGTPSADIKDNNMTVDGKYAVYYAIAGNINVTGNALCAYELTGDAAVYIESGDGNRVVEKNLHGSVNMPKTGESTYNIPENVSSFKVHDDGGISGRYSSGCTGTLKLTAPAGYLLELSGNIKTEKDNDYLTVYDGSSNQADVLIDQARSSVDGELTDIPTIISTGNVMTLYFCSDNSGSNKTEFDGLNLTVRLIYNLNETDGITDAIATKIAGKPAQFTRSFTANVASTVCLPFAIDETQAAAAGKFYEFAGVDKSGSEWEVIMQETSPSNLVSGDLAANTPYLFMPAATGPVQFYGTVSASVTPVDQNADTNLYPDAAGWTFKGTYERIDWITPQTYIYGFAATNATTVTPGKFFRVTGGSNSYALPFRAYLDASGGGANSRGVNRGIADELPETMTVRLINANGETTGIGTLSTKTGEVTFGEEWYSLDGRKLDGKPTKKGLYINKGNKVVIK